MAATPSDPAGFSRRQIMASGALATIAVLAGDHAHAAAVRRGPTAGTAPPLRMTTTSDLTTVLAESPLPPFAPVIANPGDVTVSPQQVYQPFLGVGAALTDSAAYVLTKYIAYHGYRGGPAVMSSAYGEQHLTEWRSKTTESLAITMAGMAGGYVAGGVSNWARSVILWNLALDQNGEPNQNKPDRRGVVTVNNQTGDVTQNPEYYALAHLAMFAQPGASRCLSPSYGPAYVAYSTYPSDITTTALVNPDGSVVLYVYNGASSSKTFQIIDTRNGTGLAVTMVAGELSTFVW
jgi:O-glycosyl hydrolase